MVVRIGTGSGFGSRGGGESGDGRVGLDDPRFRNRFGGRFCLRCAFELVAECFDVFAVVVGDEFGSFGVVVAAVVGVELPVPAFEASGFEADFFADDLEVVPEVFEASDEIDGDLVLV